MAENRSVINYTNNVIWHIQKYNHSTMHSQTIFSIKPTVNIACLGVLYPDRCHQRPFPPWSI